MILQYLEQGMSITPLEALTLFGCGRLAARIDDLRKMGYNIITEDENKNGKVYARYHLAKGK